MNNKFKAGDLVTVGATSGEEAFGTGVVEYSDPWIEEGSTGESVVDNSYYIVRVGDEQFAVREDDLEPASLSIFDLTKMVDNNEL